MNQRHKVLYIFVFLVISNLTFALAPKLPVSMDAICLLNRKTNTFVVIDDSLYYSLSPIDSNWIKHTYVFEGSNLKFSDFKKDYRGLSLENGRILFVFSGLGEVYELRNDSVVRIDNSSRHKNQFGATIFQHKNRVHALGGYGFFQTKNLFIFFNDDNHWTQMPTNVDIEPRMQHSYQINNDDVFIFSGYLKEHGDISKNIYQDCWKYNFHTDTWLKMGQLNINIDRSMDNTTTAWPQELLFISPHVYKLNCAKNKMVKYTNSNLTFVKNGYFDTSKNFVLLDHQEHGKRFLSVQSSDSVLSGKSIETTFFNEGFWPFNSYVILIIIVVLGLLLFLILYIKKEHIFLAITSSGHIYKAGNVFSIKGKPLSSYFNGKDLELLLKFLNCRDEALDLNMLDDVFINDVHVNTSTLKKRREQSVRLVKQTLSVVLDVNEDLVFIESYDDSDKRIKRICLNNRLLKF